MNRVGRFAIVVFTAWACMLPFLVGAAEIRDRAEAEGKLMFYAAFNANDAKMLTDGFKQLYPKIDAVFYRATDAQLMERILTESRAGQNSLGRGMEGIKPGFAPTEVLEEFERYAKIFHEIFGGR